MEERGRGRGAKDREKMRQKGRKKSRKEAGKSFRPQLKHSLPSLLSLLTNAYVRLRLKGIPFA